MTDLHRDRIRSLLRHYQNAEHTAQTPQQYGLAIDGIRIQQERLSRKPHPNPRAQPSRDAPYKAREGT